MWYLIFGCIQLICIIIAGNISWVYYERKEYHKSLIWAVWTLIIVTVIDWKIN